MEVGVTRTVRDKMHNGTVQHRKSGEEETAERRSGFVLPRERETTKALARKEGNPSIPFVELSHPVPLGVWNGRRTQLKELSSEAKKGEKKKIWFHCLSIGLGRWPSEASCLQQSTHHHSPLPTTSQFYS